MRKSQIKGNSKQLARRTQKQIDRIRRRKSVVKELNLRRQTYSSSPREQRIAQPPYRRNKIIKAPANFSFINNTAELIRFFNQMRKLFRNKYNLFIDFSDITHLTPESLTVLLSKLTDGQFTRGMDYSGNEPNDSELKDRFASSGFYDVMVPRSKHNQANVGKFRKKRSKKVEAEASDELIAFITETLYGEYRKCGGVTNALLESMGNTREHAAGKKGRYETWWAAAHCNTKEKKAYYSFVDNGVGIFKSRPTTVLETALKKLRIKSNIELLQKMLRREIASSTGIPYRGRGIPSIYKSLQRGDISNLIIITNDVYANVTQKVYKRLSPSFDGTFFYWEYPGESHEEVNVERS